MTTSSKKKLLIYFMVSREWQVLNAELICNALIDKFNILPFFLCSKTFRGNAYDFCMARGIDNIDNIDNIETYHNIKPNYQFKLFEDSFVKRILNFKQESKADFCILFSDKRFDKFAYYLHLILECHWVLYQHGEIDRDRFIFSWDKGWRKVSKKYNSRFFARLITRFKTYLLFAVNYLLFAIKYRRSRAAQRLPPLLLTIQKLSQGDYSEFANLSLLCQSNSSNKSYNRKFIEWTKYKIVGSLTPERLKLLKSCSLTDLDKEDPIRAIDRSKTLIMYSTGAFRSNNSIAIEKQCLAFRGIANAAEKLGYKLLIKLKPGEEWFLPDETKTLDFVIYISDSVIDSAVGWILPVDSTACVEYSLRNKSYSTFNIFEEVGCIGEINIESKVLSVFDQTILPQNVVDELSRYISTNPSKRICGDSRFSELLGTSKTVLSSERIASAIQEYLDSLF